MGILTKLSVMAAVMGAASPAAAQAAHAPAHPTPAPAAAGSAALTTGVTGDVRCLLTMGMVASNKANAQAGTLGVYFFEGRLTARAPNLDLTAALKTEAARMTPADLQSELRRCGSLIQQAMQSLQTAQANFQGPVSSPPGAPPAAPPAAPAPK
ncbi:hypothetical protein [Phenylobacterium sp.]|jgi:hypothetical protein|uniref:hypothetical protein n=1 Tax=Phenylobacterium sp. TaxID=1871053 RepID=UPI002F426FC4